MNWVTVTVNGTEISVAFDENSVHIYNAYPIKDDLKLRGYRWNPVDKSWHIRSSDVPAEMEVLKNNLQGSNSLVEISEKSDLSKFPDSYSVSDLRNRINCLIREGIKGNIWVRGVIASTVKNYKWASYLDLKDEDEKKDIFFRVEVKAHNFEKINRKLRESGIAESLEIDLPVFCSVDLHLPLRNVIDIRLNLLDILPEYTQSKLRNQREITIDKLKEEGILENQKKLIIPALISRLGLITSEQGTSIKDIKAGLHPYNNKYRFFFIDSRMEGANAVDSIIKAITYLEDSSEIILDAIIIARGGGSEQSLAVFSDLRLCRKVCLTRIPILTAIGHEKDVSAIELCSWSTPTPSTPSGIGKFLQNRYLNIQEQLSSTVTQLVYHFTNVFHRQMEKIKTMTRGLEQSVIFNVRDHERRISDLTRQLMKKYQEMHLRSKKSIDLLALLIISRVQSLSQRERTLVEKTILKLDFEKRHRENYKQQEEIRRKTQILVAQALKNIKNGQKDINARTQLVQASDPYKILKKGFTLTLDKGGRAIKSVKVFNQKESATLKFHDGSTEIMKKRRKNE